MEEIKKLLPSGEEETQKPAWYQDVTLEDAELYIRSNLKSAIRSVIATGYYLKHIRDEKLYLEAGYKSINEYAEDRFGFSASTTCRYIARNTKFSKDGNSPFLDERYKDFSKSQLQEMLGMSDEQLEQVTSDMTVREIRSMARPKEVPYIEIPGQTELKEIPGFMPEERVESFEASTAVLFGVEEDESMAQPVAGKLISQEISVTELVEEAETGIATSQIFPEATAANEQRNEPANATQKQQMGHCLHRPEYECSLPKEYMHRPGSGMDCTHECCWDCAKHGACKLECNSSADRPEAEKQQHWPKTCITGKSKYGNCNCCGTNGVKCCAECKESCNSRCGWLDETEEEIATSQTDIEASEDEIKECTDIEILRELLERKKQLLSKCLGIPGIDKSDEHIRMQKLEVGALTSMLCELEDLEEKKDRPKQPELPILKNDNQRKAFIDDYATWPIWIETKETGERYYRYELPDVVMVVKVYYHKCFDYKAEGNWKDRFRDEWGSPEYYLIQDGKYFKDCLTNKSSLIDYLKEIQKGEQR